MSTEAALETLPMISVKVFMRVTGEPLKRTPVVLELDPDGRRVGPVPTDRTGIARFDTPAGSGKIIVSDLPCYEGRLDGEIEIGLWSLTDFGADGGGSPGGFVRGSNAYPGMKVRAVSVNGREVLTDSEGYLVDPDDWSEAFVRSQAELERLQLTGEHWEVIRFLRAWVAERGRQAAVRDMIQHFRKLWGAAKGNNRYLHELFPNGGPQKQGNRLAGILRTKGEH